MTEVYLGDLNPNQYHEIIYWCLDRFGTHGNGWKLDLDKHTIFLDEQRAVLFSLRWAS
jgi:hypothetical protein